VKPIGVLALQGDFAAHRAALREAGADSLEVRHPGELRGVSGLILPGGESTTLVKLIREMGFVDPLKAFVAEGRPVLGTCAGAILLGRSVAGSAQFCLGFMDIDVERNAYGRQRESFESARGEARLAGGGPGDPPARMEMIFIRAPRIVRTGPGVSILATHGGDPVLVREGRLLAATFHPEMSADRVLHEHFAAMAAAPPAGGRPI
jgi:5'-phosphate synthase pdxT subunit